VKVATCGEIRRFLQADAWELVAGVGSGHDKSGHDNFRKVLPDGTLLSTHVSRSVDKTPGPDRFMFMLRDQLRVSAEDFWEAVRTAQPVARPSQVPSAPGPTTRLWVVAGLRKCGYTIEEIAALSPESAEAKLRSIWAGQS
jgi:hypothetical protein